MRSWKRGVRITRYDQFAQLKDLHEARPDFLQYGVTVARGTLTRLDRAFSAFFRRVAAGQRPGFPRFRARSRFDCVSYEDVSGWKLKEADVRLYLQGIGHVRIRLHRPPGGGAQDPPRSEAGDSLDRHRPVRRGACAQPLAPTDRQAGFDLGVANLAASSDGEFFENPRHFARGREALAAAQQALARKQRGSSGEGRPGKTPMNFAPKRPEMGTFGAKLVSDSDPKGSDNPAPGWLRKRSSTPARRDRAGYFLAGL